MSSFEVNMDDDYWKTLEVDPNPTRRCWIVDCPYLAMTSRILCEVHAYPGENKKSERRQAIEAQRKRKANK